MTALFRTTLTSAFILLMLASAHLFMVVVNAAEAAVEPPRPAAGMTARMFADRPMSDEIEAAMQRTKSPEKRQILQVALDDVRSGRSPELRTLPVTRFLVWSTLGLTAAGCLMLWITSRLKSDATQSILGIFGGNLLWTGGVEYGLTIAARSLGIGKVRTSNAPTAVRANVRLMPWTRPSAKVASGPSHR